MANPRSGDRVPPRRPPAPKREIVIHYTVALPNGEVVTLADRDSADRLCRFLNSRPSLIPPGAEFK